MNTDSTLSVTNPKPTGPEGQVKYRVNDGMKAHSMIKSGVKRVNDAVLKDRLVIDAYDRMPPLDPKEMEKSGEAWRCNVDYGGTEKTINEKVDQMVNLAMLPSPLIDLKPKPGKQVSSEVLRKVAMAYSELTNEQESWTTGIQSLCFHMVSTGVGYAHMEHPFDWEFKAHQRADIIYPPKASTNINDWPWLAVRGSIPIEDLIAKLDPENVEAATTAGWDTAKIRSLITNFGVWDSVPGGRPTNWDTDPAAWVQAVRDNDLNFASDNGSFLAVFYFYVKEFDGSYSQSILVDKLPKDGSGETKNGDFVFRRKCDHKELTKFVSVVQQSVGKDYIESIRGLGHRVLPYEALQNDLKNRAVDTTIITGGLILRGAKEDGVNNVSDITIGGVVTVIPKEFEFPQGSLANNAQGYVTLASMFREELAANQQAFGGVSGSQNIPTATQAKLSYQKDSRGSMYESDRFYRSMTSLHRNRWNRLVELMEKDSPPCPGKSCAERMLEKLKDDNITLQDIKNIEFVAASTLFGDGDPNQVFLALQDLSGLFPSMPVTAQREAYRMMVAARTRKPYLAEQWFPAAGAKDRDLSAQLWRCSTEQDAFENGSPMPLQDDDLDIIHAQEHTKWALGVITNFESGVLPPAEALKRLILCHDHTVKHMERLAGSKKDAQLYAELGNAWRDILNQMRRMEQMVKDEQAAAQQRQMEELRNPSMTVADREKMLTEQTKREQISRTEEARRQQIQLTEATKRDLLLKRAITDTEIKAIEALPLSEPVPVEAP